MSGSHLITQTKYVNSHVRDIGTDIVTRLELKRDLAENAVRRVEFSCAVVRRSNRDTQQT